uniref:Uncharacterized protein n=1 Tax=Cacopsylla melanoneura TaxID=428564 RepID=A0A8D8LBT8_9HEMI
MLNEELVYVRWREKREEKGYHAPESTHKHLLPSFTLRPCLQFRIKAQGLNAYARNLERYIGLSDGDSDHEGNLSPVQRDETNPKHFEKSELVRRKTFFPNIRTDHILAQ